MGFWQRLSRKMRPADNVRVVRTPGAPPPSGVPASALQDVVVAVRGIDPNQLPSGIDGSAAVRDFMICVGVAATCVSVRLHVANRKCRELIRQGRLPENEALQRSLGAIVVSSSTEDTHDSWGGHLVTIVDNHWLVDATLDFVNDVEPAFRLTAIVSDRGRDLVDGIRASIEFDTDLIVYERDDQNQRYLQTPAWRDEQGRKNRLFSVLASIDAMPLSDAHKMLRDRIATVAADAATD
jgi:hypothetical protein